MPEGRVGEPAAVARGLMDMLALRSPGERSAGALTTKPALTKLPRQRAKSAGLAAPATPDADSVMALVTDAPPAATGATGPMGGGDIEEFPPEIVEGPLAFLPGPGFGIGGGGGFFGGGGGGGFGGGGGGGGGGGLPPGTGPGPDVLIPPPPLPPPAIPEPATWLSMLTGFGLLGFSLRRQRRSSARPGAAWETR